MNKNNHKVKNNFQINIDADEFLKRAVRIKPKEIEELKEKEKSAKKKNDQADSDE